MTANHIPQAQRSQEKKQQIYKTAIRMFRDKGYNQTTIRDICIAAGITTGTFYNFFGDKLGIVQEYYLHLTARRDSHLELTAEKLANPYQTICDYFLSLASINSIMGKDLSRAFFCHAPEMIAGNASAGGHSVHHIALLLGKARDSGTLPSDTDPWHTAEFLSAGFLGIMQYWQNFSTDETMEEVARRMLPMIFAAVTDQNLEIK